MRSRAVWSVRRPFSSNFCAACVMNTSGLLIGKAFRKTSIWRRCYCARAVPSKLGLAPMMATGLPSKGWFGGREAQSIAFLSTPGTE